MKNTVKSRQTNLKVLLIAALAPAIVFLSLAQRTNPQQEGGDLPQERSPLEQYTEEHGKQPIAFSTENGFYSTDIMLEMTAPASLPADAFICYTLDGTDPTADSPRYEGPIALSLSGAEAGDTRAEDGSPGNNADKTGIAGGLSGAAENSAPAAEDMSAGDIGEDDDGGSDSGSGSSASSPDDLSGAHYAADNPAAGVTVYTVRARICLGEEATDVQYGIYCLGEGLFPCGDEYVVCVDTDPEGLYDYEKGILVGGKDLDENDQSKYHGNYMQKGNDWVRACHVAIFDGSGNLLTDCNAGVAVSGGMSRRLDQKSLNISFGEPYGEEGEKLALDVFPDQETADCAHVGSYSHLRLRARSQRTRTFRETLASELANESGSRLVTEPRSGIVFLNGKFYTLAELSPTFSCSLLAHRFDLPDSDHIKKKKGKDVSVFRKLDVTDLFAADLTLEENRRALEEAVDMDDYLLYYAFNVLENNLDWPRNNVEAWRWTGDYDPARPYTDGRLRFMVFDSDKAYNTDESIVETFGTDSFVSMMENTLRGYESRFRDVMKADEYRNRFVTILCDLMNTSFDTEHVLSLMREAFTENEDQYRAFFTEEYMDDILADYTLAQTAAASRNDEIREDLQTYFGLTDTYRTELSASAGVAVTWNNMYVGPDDSYSCDYYTGVPVTYTASAAPGWRFDHWEVNGTVIDGGSGQLTLDGSLPSDGSVPSDSSLPSDSSGPSDSSLSAGGNPAAKGVCAVRAVAVPEDGERLVIAEVSAAGSNDWIRLYNAGTTPVDLAAYCISDDKGDLLKFRLPPENLQPGQSCVITGSKNTETTEVRGTSVLCSCNFSLGADETLRLTPDGGGGLTGDSLRIPRMSVNCSYGRRDNGSIYCWYDGREAE